MIRSYGSHICFGGAPSAANHYLGLSNKFDSDFALDPSDPSNYDDNTFYFPAPDVTLDRVHLRLMAPLDQWTDGMNPPVAGLLVLEMYVDGVATGKEISITAFLGETYSVDLSDVELTSCIGVSFKATTFQTDTAPQIYGHLGYSYPKP